jgi:hypothetical protein
VHLNFIFIFFHHYLFYLGLKSMHTVVLETVVVSGADGVDGATVVDAVDGVDGSAVVGAADDVDGATVVDAIDGVDGPAVVGTVDGVDGPAVLGGVAVDVVLAVVVEHTLQSPQVLGHKLQIYD